MFLRCLFIIILSFLTVLGEPLLGQTIDHAKLHEEISELNDQNQNEKSLIKLEEIINNTKSTAYDKYHAYLAKSLTYKQLYNYTGALLNLENAEKEGQISKHKEEAATRVLIERIFIHFDLKNEKELSESLKRVDPKNLHYINKETRAFYNCILGHLELKKNNDLGAERYFDEGIKLLQNDNPKHLPVLYKAKIQLYNKLKDKEKVLEAFNQGMHYATRYGIDIYKISLLESMIFFYVDNNDYKNAYEVQKKVSEERRQYDAANRSGQLNALENELLQKRNSAQSAIQGKFIILYISIIILLTGLIITLTRLNKVNKLRRLSTEKELGLLRFRLLHEGTKSSSNDNEEIACTIDLSKLKPRHLKIVELIREGKTNKEIGAELFISENTVKYHLKTIYDILEINNRSALM